MTALARRRALGVALGVSACVGGGCAVERLTAVEVAGVADGGEDASTASDDAEATSDDATVDAPADGTPGDGADGNQGLPSCTDAAFTTSSPLGPDSLWADDGYNVFNNEWDTDAGPGLQTLYACSYSNWYVVSNQANDSGAVETYPNVQMNFGDVPFSSFRTVTSTFSERSPHVGVYEDAYDIWLDGVDDPGVSRQIMIWVDNYNRVPAGTQVMSDVPVGDRSYDVWRTSDGLHITLVANPGFTSGTVDLLASFNWAVALGWLPASTTLSQIDFGVEIVSTGGSNATFDFDAFSIETN